MLGLDFTAHNASNRAMERTQHFCAKLWVDAHAEFQSAGWLISVSLDGRAPYHSHGARGDLMRLCGRFAAAPTYECASQPYRRCESTIAAW